MNCHILVSVYRIYYDRLCFSRLLRVSFRCCCRCNCSYWCLDCFKCYCFHTLCYAYISLPLGQLQRHCCHCRRHCCRYMWLHCGCRYSERQCQLPYQPHTRSPQRLTSPSPHLAVTAYPTSTSCYYLRIRKLKNVS